MLKFLLITLLIVILGILGLVGSVYVYLSPEEPLPKIAAPSSVRTTPAGEMIGFQGKHGAHSWLGIPYALPPVMQLRWKAPRPAGYWKGRRERLNYGSQCVQRSIASPGQDIIGDEDCLTLNIWAPTFGPTTVPKDDERLPVMFWIHGGGNSIGSGGSDISAIYDGSLMATEYKVIVVTINYRLGHLGWFTHSALRDAGSSTESASGNFGTLDIIAALVWVQNNISYFGGDPGNVTIFGESAGGTDVLTMLASPLASGMFQKAIVQSGALRITPMSEGEEVGTDSRGPILSSREITARLLLTTGMASDKDAAFAMQDEWSAVELSSWLRGVTRRDRSTK